MALPTRAEKKKKFAVSLLAADRRWKKPGAQEILQFNCPIITVLFAAFLLAGPRLDLGFLAA